jgi:hypothetical protein
MYDPLAYFGVAVFVVVAVLFLAWFGNHTASIYAELFGHIPKPPQQPQTRPQYVEEMDSDDDWSVSGACTVVSSVMCSTWGSVRAYRPRG